MPRWYTEHMKSRTKTWVTLAKNDLALAKDLLKKPGRY
jgi:hypothetical protein